MLPNFLVIGAQKAATSWLAQCLGEHPDVFIPEVKEVYFFTRHFEAGLEWYESYFRHWSGQPAVGEATVSYISNPKAPGRIRETLGNQLKLIASLRHPVDRAYSAFWMFLSRGRIPADADFRSFFQADSRFGLRTRGLYVEQLRRYLGLFSRENLLILIYEELKQDNLKAIRDCFEFLGVDSQFLPAALSARANKAIDVSVLHHQVWGLRRALSRLPRGIEKPLLSVGLGIFKQLPKQKSYKPLDQDLRQELLSEFMPDIKDLEHLLERDLSIWYAPS